MKRAVTVMAAAASLFMMAGCSSPDAEVPPEAAEAPATVEQFASIVARHEKPIRDSADESGRCFLDMIMDDSELVAQNCVDLADSGRAAIIEIKDAFEQIGEAPAEIDELVQRLIRGGEHMETTPELDVQANCDDVTSDECSTAVNSVTRSIEEVIIPELDAWGPYL